MGKEEIDAYAFNTNYAM